MPNGKYYPHSMEMNQIGNVEHYEIIRVPGGWIYSRLGIKDLLNFSIFVPYTTEGKLCDKKSIETKKNYCRHNYIEDTSNLFGTKPIEICTKCKTIRPVKLFEEEL